MIFSISGRAARTLLTIATIHVSAVGSPALAQAQPAGDGRTWTEIGLFAAQQINRCIACKGAQAAGGPALTLSLGHTLENGFGVALTGLAFQQFSFETSFRSEYIALLGQYTPPRLPVLTVAAGTGWAKHNSDTSSGQGGGDGNILAGSLGVRMPATSTLAISLGAYVLQSIAGTPSPYLRLVSVGISVGVASGTQ
jgi:hypothetical protein